MRRTGPFPILLRSANDMQQIITAKLKLNTTPAQFQALRTTQLAYRDALNAVSSYAFEHGKNSSNVALHRGMYAELRARYGLPSQLACSVERQVATTYKGLWTKFKKNAEHRRKKITRKRFKGLDKPPNIVHKPYTIPMSATTPFSVTVGSVSAHSMGVPLFPTRATTSTLHSYGVGQASVMPSSGTIKPGKPSIYSFPRKLTYLNQPTSN